jgi:hypothetical protein
VIGYPRLISRADSNTPIGPNPTVPYGTDFARDAFQAINCLATFIRSLRDKGSIRLEGDDVKVIDMGGVRRKSRHGLRVKQPLGPARAAPDRTIIAGVSLATNARQEIRSFYRFPR